MQCENLHREVPIYNNSHPLPREPCLRTSLQVLGVNCKRESDPGAALWIPVYEGPIPSCAHMRYDAISSGSLPEATTGAGHSGTFIPPNCVLNSPSVPVSIQQALHCGNGSRRSIFKARFLSLRLINLRKFYTALGL